MTEHVCEWGLSYDYSTQNGLELYFFCKTDVNCRDRSFTADELAKFYTEYETLKAATERLSAEIVLQNIIIYGEGGFVTDQFLEACKVYADILESE